MRHFLACVNSLRHVAPFKTIDVGDGARAPRIRTRIFFGRLLCKIQAFSGKNHVKGNFVNFSGKYHKNWSILIIFSGKSHVKFGHFVNFSYTIFGQNVLPPKVD